MKTYNRQSRVVTIDIETLPAPEPDCFEEKPSGVVKAKEAHAKTALSGDSGRLLCIGFADDRGVDGVRCGVLGWDEESGRFTCDERQMLVDFWSMMRDFRPQTDRIVGHNIFDFDLKFIYKRSVVHGVRPAVELSFARYRSQPIFDTMCEWERWAFNGRISLDRLACLLSLPSSKAGGVDGSRVSEVFESGRHREIHDYCLRDVRLTRLIYRRMTFAEGATYTPGECPDSSVRFTTDELESREPVATVF
jgi:DNA polymerase elongation subunit (family B)